MRLKFLFLPFLFFSVSLTAQNIERLNLLDSIKNKSIRIVAVGDMMFGTNFPRESYLPPNRDCGSLLKPVENILLNADITFGNLEGCFLDEGPVVKRCSDTTKCYAFRMPVRFASCLANAGFDIVGIANNHIWDFGQKGADTTQFYLEKHGVKYAGLKEKPFEIFYESGLKIGLAAFSPFNHTAPMHDLDQVVRIIKSLDSVCDVVIVSFHAGGEGKEFLNVNRETEFFYGEDRGNVYEFSHLVIDAGADLVIGHGPHVPRALELYKNKLIAYSLGNFCTYARFNLDYPNSMAPMLAVKLDSKGDFLSGKIFSAIQLGEGGPLTDELKRTFKLIKKLSEEDFPESKLRFNDDGLLSISDHQ